jgi:hypothetical protein
MVRTNSGKDYFQISVVSSTNTERLARIRMIGSTPNNYAFETPVSPYALPECVCIANTESQAVLTAAKKHGASLTITLGSAHN